MVFVKFKILCTVVQRNAGARNNDAGAESAEIGLDKAHHVAVCVCTAEVNGRRASWIARFRHDGFIVNQCAAFGSIVFA